MLRRDNNLVVAHSGNTEHAAAVVRAGITDRKAAAAGPWVGSRQANNGGRSRWDSRCLEQVGAPISPTRCFKLAAREWKDRPERWAKSPNQEQFRDHTGDPRRPHSIRFPDSGWAQIEEAALRHRILAGEIVRSGALAAAGERLAAPPPATVSPGHMRSSRPPFDCP